MPLAKLDRILAVRERKEPAEKKAKEKSEASSEKKSSDDEESEGPVKEFLCKTENVSYLHLDWLTEDEMIDKYGPTINRKLAMFFSKQEVRNCGRRSKRCR